MKLRNVKKKTLFNSTITEVKPNKITIHYAAIFVYKYFRKRVLIISVLKQQSWYLTILVRDRLEIRIEKLNQDSSYLNNRTVSSVSD